MHTRLIALFACLLGLLATIPAHAATADVKDVFGRDVPLGQGRPAVVLYANRGTREVLREHVFEFAYGLRQERPIVVVHVDLRDVPGLFRGTARRELRKSHSESLEQMKELFRQQGQQPPADLEESLFMVPDFQGEPHRELGMKKGFDQVLARALGPSGEELARGSFPERAADIGKAIGSGRAPSVARAH